MLLSPCYFRLQSHGDSLGKTWTKPPSPNIQNIQGRKCRGYKYLYAVAKSGCTNQITRDGTSLGGWFLEKNCWPTISKQQTESEGNLWFLYDSEMNSFIRLTTSESIRRVWHTRGTARAYSKAGHAGADSGEHPHSGRTFNFRFRSKQMLKPPLCLENFKLILKVKHVLWLLAESKTGR